MKKLEMSLESMQGQLGRSEMKHLMGGASDGPKKTCKCLSTNDTMVSCKGGNINCKEPSGNTYTLNCNEAVCPNFTDPELPSELN